MYTMWRAYSSKGTDLPTDDVLEAVKMSLNYEADLYVGNRLLASWMGLEMEENSRRLAKEGIETYVVDGRYCFKYRDPSKNVKRIFFQFIKTGNDQGEVHLSDYRSKMDQPFYSSVEDVYEVVKKEYPYVSILTVVDFSGDKYTGSYKVELKEVI